MLVLLNKVGWDVISSNHRLLHKQEQTIEANALDYLARVTYSAPTLTG